MGFVASVLGVLVSAFGTIAQMSAASKQAKAMKDAERARKRQMELDAMRQRRKIIRDSVVQRSKVRAAAASGGMLESSPVQGSLGSITAISAGNVHAVNQSEQLGRQVFDANMRAIDAQEDAAMASGFMSLAGSFGKFFRTFV